MREAKLARRCKLVIVPGLPGMRAAQIEHRLDPIFANRPARVVFAQLSRTVKDSRVDRVQIALVLENPPIAADRGGEQHGENPGDLEASNMPSERPRLLCRVSLCTGPLSPRCFGVRHHLSEAIPRLGAIEV